MGHVGWKLARRPNDMTRPDATATHTMAVVDARASFLAVGVATASIHFAYPRWDGQAELANGHGFHISTRLNVW